MRIRNKLITVQLILTLTLLLSILIFSFHMNKYLTIQSTQIELGHLDSLVTRLDTSLNSAINKRTHASQISLELTQIFTEYREYINYLNDSELLKTTVLREYSKKLNVSYIAMNSITFKNYVGILDNTVEPEINSLMYLYGVEDSIKKLKFEPKSIELPENKSIEILSNFDKIYLAHEALNTEFKQFKKLWSESYGGYKSRLESLKTSSAIITVITLIFLLFIAFTIGFRITNKITVNLNDVNNSLAKMTSGDFSTTLHIAAGDEFGDLARHFNHFIEQLWKKLDSMNVIMGDIGHAMNENLDLTKIQSNILQNVTNHIITDASAIFSLKDNNLKMTSSKGHFPPFFPIVEDLSSDRPKASRYLHENIVPLDSDLIAECFETKSPRLIKECETSPYFPQCKNKNSALFISSLMMVPLINAGNIIGLFVVIRTTNKKPFSDLDFTNFSSFSDYAALTIDTLEKYNELLEKFEMQKEIGVAADIQQSLVPGQMPKVKGLTSSAYTLAAKGVSGDYYDFFRMNRSTVGATVCDVAGKGVPASLVMVMIRTILRLVSSPSRGAAETLTMLNRSISGKIDVDRYATMGFFKIDLDKMKLNYSNAAHHPIQIFRQSTQKFYAIDSPGLPIGIDRDATFMEKRVSLFPGDIIFMYTDGFPEARNHDGDEYSTNRMLREIRLHCNSNANQILDSIVTDMQKFTSRASQHDDQTILIIKIDEDK